MLNKRPVNASRIKSGKVIGRNQLKTILYITYNNILSKEKCITDRRKCNGDGVLEYQPYVKAKLLFSLQSYFERMVILFNADDNTCLI